MKSKLFFLSVWMFLSLSLPLLSYAEPSGSIGALVSQAKKASQRGDLASAKKYYDQALQQMDWVQKNTSQIRKDAEAINMKLIFSKSSFTAGNKIHVVKEGETLSEIAKKYGTTTELIKRSNQLNSEHIQAGRKLKVLAGKVSIKVDKSANQMEIYLDEKRIKSYRVATGKRNSTPVGTFKIINKVRNPIWYKEMGTAIPYGDPENHLGPRWMGFDKPSYGIHGTVEPKTIGTQASSGCIRMLNKDVEEIYAVVPIGTKVTVQN